MASPQLLVPILVLLLHAQLMLAVASQGEGPSRRIQRTFDFAANVKKYGKFYDKAETLARANLFHTRTMGTFKLNSLYISRKTSHYLSQDEYTDMTPSEIKRTIVNNDLGLVPIREASLLPEAPADLFEHGTKIRDGSSRASLSRSSPTPVVNFFSDATSE